MTTAVTTTMKETSPMRRHLLLPALALVALVGCADDSSGTTTEPTTPASVAATEVPPTEVPSTEAPSTEVPGTDATAGETIAFTAEVWADNWFSLYVNGELVGEDSVPITTERSFNAETITFTATYPLTIAMVTKDFKETDSGLEYIGTDRQQMGDGGFIAQITDTSTGEIVATTGADWRNLVIHRAPLNQDCAGSADPNTDCQFESLDEPADWTAAAFDDSAWGTAAVYTAEQVGAKDGYDTITWSADASLIWSSDLKVDNTILWRTVVAG
ncbi:MAG: PEBP family protein [Ilumatobacteraceae bacterium]